MRTIIIIAVTILFVACRKSKPEFDGIHCSGNCYILTGKILDTPSNSGLQGAEVKFFYRPSGYTLITDPTRYLGRTTTNSNGDYKFQFDGTKYKISEGYYRIEISKSGYYKNDWNVFYLDSSQFNIPFNQNIALFRPAKLSVRVRATAVTNFDYLTVTYYYGGPGGGITLNGKRAIDTTITFPVAGDIRTFVKWDAVGNGVNIHKNDTLFTTRDGTIQYQINF